MRPGRALVCLAVIAACHAGVHPRRPGQTYIAAIHIEGSKAIPAGTLIPGLELDRRRALRLAVDEYQLQLDQERITGAYERAGYFGVVVTSHVTVAPPRDKDDGPRQTVTFTVVPGPRATTHVEIAGLPPGVSPADARAAVALAEGAPFDYDAYDDAKATLLRLVDDAGYAHATLDAGVVADRGHARAVVRYTITAGPRCTFGPITIEGASGALADAIRARVTIRPGAPFSLAAIEATQQAIYAMHRFSSVRVDPDRRHTATVLAVRVAVSESNHGQLLAGGGFGLDPLDYLARLRVDFSQTGWPSPLSTVGVQLQPAITLLRTDCVWYEPWKCQAEPLVRLLGTLTQQDLFVPNLVGRIEGGADYLTIEAYRIEGLHVKLGVTTPLGTPRLQLQLGWLLGAYQFTHFSPAVDDATAAALHIDGTERLGYFSEALVVDLRDDPVEPHRGAYAELRAAEGGSFAGGAFSYLQLTPDVRGYLPLGPLVLAARARLGLIIGDVPPTERYYAGGASSDRGFPERQLSPIATASGTSVVIGGAALAETGAELRVPLGSPYGIHLGGVAFVDGGDVRQTAGELDLAGLHWAVGAGLRWYVSALGPVRLDFAYRLGHDSPDEPRLGRFQFFLSLGEAY